MADGLEYDDVGTAVVNSSNTLARRENAGLTGYSWSVMITAIRKVRFMFAGQKRPAAMPMMGERACRIQVDVPTSCSAPPRLYTWAVYEFSWML